MIRLVTVGPFPIFFGNVNVAMGLPGHHHAAQVVLVYGHRDEEHGYPSFQATNDELRAELSAHTGKRNTFRDATNEDVAERLFMLMCQFVPESARRYGGSWWLDALHLDVESNQDEIGHDNGTTRYTIALPAQGLGRWVLPDRTFHSEEGPDVDLGLVHYVPPTGGLHALPDVFSRRMTDDPTQVTCPVCLQAMKG